VPTPSADRAHVCHLAKAMSHDAHLVLLAGILLAAGVGSSLLA
jgi:hypothetical protein